MAGAEASQEAEPMGKARVEAFSDGVIAVAITLLALDLHVPDPTSTASLGDALGEQWPSYVAYLVSFLTIGIIWITITPCCVAWSASTTPSWSSTSPCWPASVSCRSPPP